MFNEQYIGLCTQPPTPYTIRRWVESSASSTAPCEAPSTQIMTMLFPPDALPKGPPVDAKKALLLIDLQKDFVDPDGKLPVPNVSSFIPNIATLANKFRSKGSIIWVQTEYAQPRLTISPETGFSSILLKQHLEAVENKSTYQVRHQSAVSSPTDPDLQPFQTLIQHDPEAFLDRSYESNDKRPCMPGSTGAELPEPLASVVEPEVDMSIVKSDYSAFAETSLLLQLRTRMVTHVYVCGSLSNISVYATVLDAVGHGLEVTLVEDCLGYLNLECHTDAMRQMADDMGASGIDYQELMDDLSGLLGDVIREEDFSSHFQVSIPQPSRAQARAAVPPSQRNQRVEEWIASAGSKRRQAVMESQGSPSTATHERHISTSNESRPKAKTPKAGSRQGTPDLSPPRKRATSDLDETEEVTPQPPPRSSSRRQPPETDSGRRMVKNKPRLRNTRSSQESSARPPPSLRSLQALQSKSTGDIPDKAGPTMLSDSDSQGPSLASPRTSAATLPQSKKQKKNKNNAEILGPNDTIGEGDCRLVCDIVPPKEADDSFQRLKDDVRWQKMYHRSGEVPRLVAVQGQVSESGNEIPIYRHPADESPELLPFDFTVDSLRRAAEQHIGHPLNHVLIQWYRSGEDNISEHSDKTLDIVRGSSIVNLSFGAQRTMTLRTKKQISTLTTSSPTPGQVPQELDAPQLDAAPRTTQLDTIPRSTQRVPLPHASLFVLGQTTNQHYLHAIRADKRSAHEKSPEELAFNGERISLTFRQIGTFINTSTKMIWGQGATGKTREEAKSILQGAEAEKEGEKMIKAFGAENHWSGGWIWEGYYGRGFDVVNFEGHEVAKKPKEHEISKVTEELE